MAKNVVVSTIVSLITVALAFALVLQMETERRQANFIPPVPVDAS